MRKRVRRWLLLVGLVIGAGALFVAYEYLNRGRPGPDGQLPSPMIVAHRGVHQNYEKGVYDLATGCEATHIFPPTSDEIENTVASVAAAFDAGATIVEIDIRRTADDEASRVTYGDYFTAVHQCLERVI